MVKALINKMSGTDRTRVLGIDPSSNAIAWTVIEDGRPVRWGKMIFYRKSTLADKFKMLKPMIDLMVAEAQPTFVVIEQMISVQNPQTTRILSYIAGAIYYELSTMGYEVVDTPPMTWKNYHGYTRVTKNLIAANRWTKKEADHFRKSQLQDKIADKWEWFKYSDSDVSDSCGIALWGAEVSLK